MICVSDGSITVYVWPPAGAWVNWNSLAIGARGFVPSTGPTAAAAASSAATAFLAAYAAGVAPSPLLARLMAAL